MKRLLLIASLFSATVQMRFAQPQAVNARFPLHVSMIQLVGTPDRFDGELVSVVGFLTLGTEEDDALYLHQEDAVNSLSENSVNIERSKEMIRDEKKLNGKYVILVGRFKRGRSSPISIGTITDIKTCKLWSDPEHPITRKSRQLLHYEK